MGMDPAYLLEVLALELSDQGGETLVISLDSDGLENGLDILLRGRGVVAEGQEEVSCEVLHLDCCRVKLSVPVVDIRNSFMGNQSPGEDVHLIRGSRNRRFNQFNRKWAETETSSSGG
jgi:hypothetical protein